MSTIEMNTSQGIVTKSVTNTKCWERRQERGIVEASQFLFLYIHVFEQFFISLFFTLTITIASIFTRRTNTKTTINNTNTNK